MQNLIRLSNPAHPGMQNTIIKDIVIQPNCAMQNTIRRIRADCSRVPCDATHNKDIQRNCDTKENTTTLIQRNPGMENTRRICTFVRDFLQKTELPRSPSTAPATKSEKAWNVQYTGQTIQERTRQSATRASAELISSAFEACEKPKDVAHQLSVKTHFMPDFLQNCNCQMCKGSNSATLPCLPWLFWPLLSVFPVLFLPFRIMFLLFLLRSFPFTFFLAFPCLFSSVFFCSLLFISFSVFCFFVLLWSCLIVSFMFFSLVCFSSFHGFHFFPCPFLLFSWLYFSLVCHYIPIML